jgi:pimeloyl-ACP methyl ester carboxylesterase
MLSHKTVARLLAPLAPAIFASVVAAGEPMTPYGDNPAAGHTATVNGIGLYYEVYGTGAPLVVLHGNGGNLGALRYQIEFFRSRREVIAIDSRGHGKSELGPGRLTYEQMADDVAVLLAQRHSAPADVIGWSDGGIVALLLALHHPAAVRRLAVSGVNVSPDALSPADLTALTADLHNAEVKLAAGDRSRPWKVIGQQLQLMITQPHLTPADLARITAPVLLLAGEHDIFPEAYTRGIAAALPHAQVHIFPGADHGALQEVPDAFNATVMTFFTTPP